MSDAAGLQTPSTVVIANLLRWEGTTGVQQHTRFLYEGLVESGFPCAIQTPFSGSRKWLPVFAIRRLLLDRLPNEWAVRWHRHWHYVALYENLRNFLATRPAAAIIAQCPLSALAALEARASLGLDVKVAHICHFNISQAEEARVRGELDFGAVYDEILALEVDVLHRVDEAIYVSHWAKEVIEGRGIRPKSSRVVWNGIPETTPDSNLHREELGLEPDHLVLINVGTLEARKNQIGLIRLFAAVVARYPGARLLLVGDGPQRLEVEREIDRVGVRSSVLVLGNRDDVPALLRLADLYIHYAWIENFPLTLLEAARAALPIAALPVGGVPELLSELQAGVLLDPNDDETALQALQPLLEDPGLRRSLGLCAKHSFRRKFTSDAMVYGYLSALGLSTGVGDRLAE